MLYWLNNHTEYSWSRHTFHGIHRTGEQVRSDKRMKMHFKPDLHLNAGLWRLLPRKLPVSWSPLPLPH